jgi:L-seryl-tRNA(Ser) seleniumtransferase
VRIDKLSLAAVEATLRLYLDPAAARREVPVLRMLGAERGELQARAEAMRSALIRAGVRAEVVDSASKVGGGALPLLELEGPACAVDPAPLAVDELAARLHAGEPAVVGRLHRGRLLLDPRTLADADAERAAEAVMAALRA